MRRSPKPLSLLHSPPHRIGDAKLTYACYPEHGHMVLLLKQVNNNLPKFPFSGKYIITFVPIGAYKNLNAIDVVKSSELLRILQRDGWYMVSQKGSHLKMIHPTKAGELIVPLHGNKEIGKGLEKKLFKRAGIKK